MSQFTVSKPEVEDEPVTSPVYLLLKAKGKVLEALLYGREGGLENTLTAFPRPEVPVF